MSPKAVAKARVYTLVAIVLSLLVAGAGYMLGFSPLWTASSDANAAAEDQEARNDSEQRQVNVLRAQFAQIDGYRGMLGALRVQVPTTLQHQEFQRQLAEITSDHDVTVNRLEFDTSQRVMITNGEAAVAALPIASEALGANDSDASDSDTATSDADDADSGSSAAQAQAEAKAKAEEEAKKLKFRNFYIVPVTVELQGTYVDTVRAIQALQLNERRLFLVSKIEAVAQEQSGSSSDDTGELVVVLEGQLSVFLDPEAAKSQPDSESIERPALPGTGLDRNPLTGS